jgi:SAM-dependent methyltransferase
MSKSNSELRDVGLLHRLRYLSKLFRLHIERLIAPPNFNDLFDEISFYDDRLKQLSGLDIQTAITMEIGVGQRPYRLAIIRSLGGSAKGIDLDTPIVSLSAKRVYTLFKENGPNRALKTIARVLIFDAADRRALGRAFHKRYGTGLQMDEESIVIGSAGDSRTWPSAPHSVDFVYSEDVFEHIPPDDLEECVRLMARALSPNGLAIVSPMVFTGICGGHQPEWYPSAVRTKQRPSTPAWGHLTGETQSSDTYLNRLSLSDYRRIFRAFFDILEEFPVEPDLGRRYLTEERAARLRDFSEEELFSNKVRFVLRTKQVSAVQTQHRERASRPNAP